MAVSFKFVLVAMLVGSATLLVALILSVMLSYSGSAHQRVLRLLMRETVATVHQRVAHQVTRGIEPAVAATRAMQRLRSPYSPMSRRAKRRAEAAAAARGPELPSVRLSRWQSLLNASSDSAVLQEYQTLMSYVGLRGLAEMRGSGLASAPASQSAVDYHASLCFYKDASFAFGQVRHDSTVVGRALTYVPANGSFLGMYTFPSQISGTVYDASSALLAPWQPNRTLTDLSASAPIMLSSLLPPSGAHWRASSAENETAAADGKLYSEPSFIVLGGNFTSVLLVLIGRRESSVGDDGELSVVCGGFVIGPRLESAVVEVLEPLVASSSHADDDVADERVQPQMFVLDGLGTVIASHTQSWAHFATALPFGTDPLEKKPGCIRAASTNVVGCRKSIADHPDYELLRQAQIQLGLNLTNIRDAVQRGNRTRTQGVEKTIVTGVVTDPRLDGDIEYDVNFVHLRSLYPTVDHFSILVFMPRDFLRGPIAQARNTAIGVSVALVVVALVLAVAAAYMVGREVDVLTREMADPWRVESGANTSLYRRAARSGNAATTSGAGISDATKTQPAASGEDAAVVGGSRSTTRLSEMHELVGCFLDMLEQVRTVRAFMNVDVLRGRSAINTSERRSSGSSAPRSASSSARQSSSVADPRLDASAAAATSSTVALRSNSQTLAGAATRLVRRVRFADGVVEETAPLAEDEDRNDTDDDPPSPLSSSSDEQGTPNASFAGPPRAAAESKQALTRYLERQQLASDIHNLRRFGLRVMCVAWCDFPIMGKMVAAIERGNFIVKKPQQQQQAAHGQSETATRHAALEDVITVSRAIARCCTTLLEKHPVSCIEYVGDALVLCFSIRNLAKRSRILCQLLVAVMEETLTFQSLRTQCVWPRILDAPKAAATATANADPASVWERPCGGLGACSILVAVGIFVGAVRPVRVVGLDAGVSASDDGYGGADAASASVNRPHSVIGAAVENARRIASLMVQHEGDGTIADVDFSLVSVLPHPTAPGAEHARGSLLRRVYQHAFLGAATSPTSPRGATSFEVDDEWLDDAQRAAAQGMRLGPRADVTGCVGHAVGLPLALAPLLGDRRSLIMAVREPVPTGVPDARWRRCRAVVCAPIPQSRRAAELPVRENDQLLFQDKPGDVDADDEEEDAIQQYDDASAPVNQRIRVGLARVVPTPLSLLQ